jgi:hypothetical protein
MKRRRNRYWKRTSALQGYEKEDVEKNLVAAWPPPFGSGGFIAPAVAFALSRELPASLTILGA